MATDFGANRALVASDQAPAGLGPSGFDHGYEAWREALCQFYERDEMRQKAENLRRGDDFDYLDLRAIDALKAAVEAAPLRKAA